MQFNTMGSMKLYPQGRGWGDKRIAQAFLGLFRKSQQWQLHIRRGELTFLLSAQRPDAFAGPGLASMVFLPAQPSSAEGELIKDPEAILVYKASTRTAWAT